MNRSDLRAIESALREAAFAAKRAAETAPLADTRIVKGLRAAELTALANKVSREIRDDVTRETEDLAEAVARGAS
jgi:hypothetical protein